VLPLFGPSSSSFPLRHDAECSPRLIVVRSPLDVVLAGHAGLRPEASNFGYEVTRPGNLGCPNPQEKNRRHWFFSRASVGKPTFPSLMRKRAVAFAPDQRQDSNRCAVGTGVRNFRHLAAVATRGCWYLAGSFGSPESGARSGGADHAASLPIP